MTKDKSVGRDELDTHLAKVNENLFLREFCFAELKFKNEEGQERELADHVVCVGPYTLVFQAKRRDDGTADAACERTWYEKKVLKAGTKQIRDSLEYLAGGLRSFTNQRGHELPLGDVSNPVKCMVFSAAPLLKRRAETRNAT